MCRDHKCGAGLVARGDTSCTDDQCCELRGQLWQSHKRCRTGPSTALVISAPG
jgi:hypothetical protein